MSIKRCYAVAFGIIALGLTIFFADSWAQKKKLTYKQVFEQGEPRLLDSLPRIQRWLDENHYLEMRSEETENEASFKLMKINATTEKASIHFDSDKYLNKLPKGFSLSGSATQTEDNTGFIFDQNNDLYYFSTKTEVFKQLTANPDSENNPAFSPNNKYVAYTRDHNLYIINVETLLERQLTNDGSETIYNGWASWVYYEEILGRGSRYAAFWWAPNSEMIAFLRFDDSPVPTFPLFRADGPHGELEITHYPKAGDHNPYVKLGIYHLNENKLVWINIEEKKDHYIAWPFWTRDSKQLFFQWMNREQDHIKIYSADPETGNIKKIYDERQDAWVEFFEDLYFLKDGSGFLLRSNRDGWDHLYYYDLEGKLKSRLTEGEWRVRDIALVDEKNETVYFRGTKEASTETHLYQVDFKGKNLKRLTKIEGNHRCMISPGGKYYIDTYSNIYVPTKIDLFSIDGKLIRNLGDQKLEIMNSYALGKTELFKIPSGDGYDLPAVWVLPPDFDVSKQYPVLFRIYSGPASPTVSNSYQSLIWHYYAQNNIIVISVDHRGSGHFGKKGVALMYRNLGKWEMNDLIAAVKWLRTKPYVDPQHIGINGGSYGGYTTCMALTYGSDYFTHGNAGSSVTDWKLYDTVYTERYMDTPEDNPKGYEFGSVMTHAEKYNGHLLITHGTMDDNVHMQNTIQLISKLQDLNKDFELMLYPNARHGVGHPKHDHFVREGVQFWFRYFLNRKLDVKN